MPTQSRPSSTTPTRHSWFFHQSILRFTLPDTAGSGAHSRERQRSVVPLASGRPARSPDFLNVLGSPFSHASRTPLGYPLHSTIAHPRTSRARLHAGVSFGAFGSTSRCASTRSCTPRPTTQPVHARRISFRWSVTVRACSSHTSAITSGMTVPLPPGLAKRVESNRGPLGQVE